MGVEVIATVEENNVALNVECDVYTGSGGGGEYQSKSVSYTPTESQQTATVTPDQDYDALSSVDVTVEAIPSTYVGSGITRRTGTDLTASGPTVSVPAGYYASAASKSVTTANHPAPTLSISNAGVITATHDQPTGYVTGGTTTESITMDVWVGGDY